MNKEIEGSICKDCINLGFYDWYLCHDAPYSQSDDEGFLRLPIKECINYEKDTE